MVDHLTLSGSAGAEKIPSPKNFQGNHDYLEVRREETVTLVVALQSCVVQSGTPPGVLCGPVQDLHQCLAPLIEEDGLLNLEMLDVAKKDPGTRGDSPFRERLRPHMGQIPNYTTGIWLLMSKLSPCWFGKGYTPRSATRLQLGSLQVTISHGLVAEEVLYEYQFQVITQALLQLP